MVAFLRSHHELITIILKDRAPVITLASLVEVQLTTAIFYHLAKYDSIVREQVRVGSSCLRALSITSECATAGAS